MSDTKINNNLDKRPDFFFLKCIFQGGAQNFFLARLRAPIVHPPGLTFAGIIEIMEIKLSLADLPAPGFQDTN